jgi:hypothetical protein
MVVRQSVIDTHYLQHSIFKAVTFPTKVMGGSFHQADAVACPFASLRYLKLSHLLYHRVPISRCAKINHFLVNENFGVMLISPDR